jgi:hypothetical protein
VYDCIEPSPFYETDDPNDQYIDERDAIELPSPTENSSDGVVSEPYQKKYYFNPNNLPY